MTDHRYIVQSYTDEANQVFYEVYDRVADISVREDITTREEADRVLDEVVTDLYRS
jgi:hypothetical protein